MWRFDEQNFPLIRLAEKYDLFMCAAKMTHVFFALRMNGSYWKTQCSNMTNQKWNRKKFRKMRKNRKSKATLKMGKKIVKRVLVVSLLYLHCIKLICWWVKALLLNSNNFFSLFHKNHSFFTLRCRENFPICKLSFKKKIQ